jgi:hypothetical protein
MIPQQNVLGSSSAIGSVRSLRFESLSVLRCLRVHSKSRSQFKVGKDKDRRPFIHYWKTVTMYTKM